ncbi:Asp-tRNA(Asn)/Glu-tRNA(Gln) amidotransferase subunit GatA [Candidatus Woesearchaeota archaeon]|nr:Asp-tRNA(Asn)/Glu-tRNA(Gln) amidotransferase subunit GatA [Candidatus Woesearchaeota archaeon]
MKVQEFIKKVQNKEIDIVEHTYKVLEECKKINKEYHYLNTISEELALRQAEAVNKNPKGKLAGLPISIKDSICVKDVESTAGSKILRGYKPYFHATAVEKAIKEGAIVIGKTSQDEFGFGGFATNVGIDLKIPLNPFDKNRATGGSSGGAGGLTQKASFAHIALGECTGGSIESPASFCGVFGLVPTYGRVSRYGLIDYANSFDKVGPLGKNIYDCALMLDVISGYDEKDSSSLNEKKDDFFNFLKKDIKGLKVGVIKESFGEGVDEKVSKHVWDGIKRLEKNGASYKETSLPITMKHGVPTYYLLATTEASTNLAKYCGMRYGASEELKGNFDEYFTDVRSKNFGKEAKRRLMLGTFARMSGFRDAYYIKAAKVRTLIIEEYKKALKNFDVLITPTMPILPPTFDELKKLTPLQDYMMDIMTVGPNLAGLPHMGVPVGFEKNLPVGMMIISDHLNEGKLLQVGKEFDKN